MLQNISEGIKSQIGNYVLNQEVVTELALTAFFAGGHILLVGPTGLGKAKWARAFAGALGLDYNSAQLTESTIPDRLYSTYTQDGENQPVSRPGALFSPVFHAKFYESNMDNTFPRFDNTQEWAHMRILDAIDRNERATNEYGSESFSLPDPHFIIASLSDTRILPKPLVDRFMMKLYINYPGVAAEKQILQAYHTNAPEPEPTPICTPETIAQAKQEVQAVMVDDAIFNYIVSIAETTRRISAIQTGVSPRASMALLQAAKAYAVICGRDYVTTSDVKSLAIPVLRHRITLRPDAVKEGVNADRIIESII